MIRIKHGTWGFGLIWRPYRYILAFCWGCWAVGYFKNYRGIGIVLGPILLGSHPRVPPLRPMSYGYREEMLVAYNSKHCLNVVACNGLFVFGIVINSLQPPHAPLKWKLMRTYFCFGMHTFCMRKFHQLYHPHLKVLFPFQKWFGRTA